MNRDKIQDKINDSNCISHTKDNILGANTILGKTFNKSNSQVKKLSSAFQSPVLCGVFSGFLQTDFCYSYSTNVSHICIIYKYIHYIPGTQMTSIFEGQPPKTRPFPIKTRVSWVPGMYCFISFRCGLDDNHNVFLLKSFCRRLNRQFPEWPESESVGA